MKKSPWLHPYNTELSTHLRSRVQFATYEITQLHYPFLVLLPDALGKGRCCCRPQCDASGHCWLTSDVTDAVAVAVARVTTGWVRRWRALFRAWRRCCCHSRNVRWFAIRTRRSRRVALLISSACVHSLTFVHQSNACRLLCWVTLSFCGFRFHSSLLSSSVCAVFWRFVICICNTQHISCSVLPPAIFCWLFTYLHCYRHFRATKNTHTQTTV